MSELRKSLLALGAAAVLAIVAAPLPAQNAKGASVEAGAAGDFFIISSVDPDKKQILLKLPTEVTQLMQVDGRTRYLDGKGKAMQLRDLRAGDTVYIVSNRSGEQLTAVNIRKGPMTLEVLRERYLGGKK